MATTLASFATPQASINTNAASLAAASISVAADKAATLATFATQQASINSAAASIAAASSSVAADKATTLATLATHQASINSAATSIAAALVTKTTITPVSILKCIPSDSWLIVTDNATGSGQLQAEVIAAPNALYDYVAHILMVALVVLEGG
ncbi:hypothetical protein T492DRAFT_848034 [Pavlovales sp. CCMP2436]|nr:hypothetical protein T492DRAFT_848034 [Pavlovales sp. CCMP2436]